MFYKSPLFFFVLTAINNFVNCLGYICAASNFILYCALSDKYRKTIRLLLCGHQIIRKNTFSSSRFQSGRTATSFYSKSQNSNGSFFNPAKRISAKQPKIIEPKRFSVSKAEYENLKAETDNLKLPPYSPPPQQSETENHHNSIVSTTQKLRFSFLFFKCLIIPILTNLQVEEIPMSSIKEKTNPSRSIKFTLNGTDDDRGAIELKHDTVSYIFLWEKFR